MSTTQTDGPQAGWYSSPSNPEQRFWNGEDWTERPAPVEKATSIVWVGYVFAIVFPLVGLLLGIIAATRPEKATNRHGVWVIVLSTVAFVVWIGASLAIAHSTHSSGTCLYNPYTGKTVC